MVRSKIALVGSVLLWVAGCATTHGGASEVAASAATMPTTTGAEVPAPASSTTVTAPATDTPATDIAPAIGIYFDRALATKVVRAGVERAKACHTADGPTGKGRAVLTFAPDGTVSDVELAEPFRDTDVGACVIGELRQVWVNPFEGASITVAKSFEIAPL